jgi:hypothetical protein
MKTKRFLLPVIFLSILLVCQLSAANYVVELGENIQTQVANAQSGDVVIVRGGEYRDQNITISDPIRLVREKGTNVTIGGLVTYSGVNGEVVLRDFPISAVSKGKLVVSNCTKFGMQNVRLLPEGFSITGSTVVIRDCKIDGALSISGASNVEIIDSNFTSLTINGSSFHAKGSKFTTLTVTNDSNVTLEDSNFTTASITGGKAVFRNITATGNVTFTQCDWQDHGSTYNENLTSNESHSRLSRSTVKKAFTHGHASYGGVNLDCVIFQSTIGRQTGALLHSKANRTWVTYSYIHHALQTGGTEAHFIGNKVYTNVVKGNNGVLINGANCVASILNNHFYNGHAGGVLAIASDLSEKRRGYTSWAAVKTIELLVPRIVNYVKNELKNEHSSYTGYCKIKFYYSDNTTVFSTAQQKYGSTWQTKQYNNPNPGKFVSKIEIWSRSNYQYHTTEAYTKNDNVYGIYGNSEGVYIASAKKVTAQNNLFRDGDINSNCIFSPAVPTDGMYIYGNAFWRSSEAWQQFAVNSPKGADRMLGNSPVPAPDICSHNYFQDSAKGVTGGIVNNNNITGADPGFVNPVSDWSLTSESILKDKGPTEAQFNDHDGSRNDIGYKGGHRYDVNGTTTTKPVILSADQTHFRVTKGDNVSIEFTSRGAVVTP